MNLIRPWGSSVKPLAEFAGLGGASKTLPPTPGAGASCPPKVRALADPGESRRRLRPAARRARTLGPRARQKIADAEGLEAQVSGRAMPRGCSWSASKINDPAK